MKGFGDRRRQSRGTTEALCRVLREGRRITAERAGGIAGLIRAGGFGAEIICCIRIAVTLSPWKGQTPVHIS